MLQTLSKLEIEGNFLNLTKDIYSSEALATDIWRIVLWSDMVAEACQRRNEVLGTQHKLFLQGLAMIGKKC